MTEKKALNRGKNKTKVLLYIDFGHFQMSKIQIQKTFKKKNARFSAFFSVLPR
jgi:hypothetical protein